MWTQLLQSCLNQCWDESEDCCCPLCKETFSKRPDLKINTALRVVQLFKEKSGVTASEVLCDICDDRKLKALMHLELHHRGPRLIKHKLINAVENLEDYICEQHERPLELFCRDDQTPVCPICTVTDHKNHNTVPLEEESEEKKAWGQNEEDSRHQTHSRTQKSKFKKDLVIFIRMVGFLYKSRC